MRVLVLAPQPFYQERGTPIAVDLVVRSLSERGHQVDLLVFHEGRDVAYPHVTLHRIRALSFVRNVRPGFSVKKLICDFLFFWKSVDLVRKNRPDVVHAVEEAAFMAYVLRVAFGIPYIYDMDSSLPDQVVEKIPLFLPLRRLMLFTVKFIAAHALLVAPVCEAIALTVVPCEPAKVFLLRDVSLIEEEEKKHENSESK